MIPVFVQLTPGLLCDKKIVNLGIWELVASQFAIEKNGRKIEV